MPVADRRTLFERSLRHVRCNKCGSKVLELEMPNVICSKCSTKYILAVSTKGFLLQLDYKLIEQKEEIKEKEIITKEVVMIPCQYCRGLMVQTSTFCSNCGAKRKA